MGSRALGGPTLGWGHGLRDDGTGAGCRGRADRGQPGYPLEWLWMGDGNEEGLRREPPGHGKKKKTGRPQKTGSPEGRARLVEG